jgi:hypothetical protein
MSQRLTKIPGEKYLYKDESGTYYLRIREDGQDTNLSLKTKKITQAVKARDARMAAKAAARLGIAAEPSKVAKVASVTVRKVITTYQEAGYPGMGGVVRADGKHRVAEEGYCKTILAYFNGDAPAGDLVQDDLDQYHSWRIAHVTRGDGHRTTDLELNTLNNATRWAVRKRMLKTSPTASRERYQSSKNVKHCRDYAPSDMEECHVVAGVLMSTRPSETLGWQYLFEEKPLEGPADKSALTKALGRLFANCARNKKISDPKKRLLELKKKFTSHGARAFYVFVRRSQGATDAQIAYEINHVGGVATLEKVYGIAPPHWRDSKAAAISWIPKGSPAWERIQP